MRQYTVCLVILLFISQAWAVWDLISNVKESTGKSKCQHKFSMIIDNNRDYRYNDLKSKIISSLQGTTNWSCLNRKSKKAKKNLKVKMVRKFKNEKKKRKAEKVILNITFLTKL